MGIVVESSEELITSDQSLEKNIMQQKFYDKITKHIVDTQKAYLKYFVPFLDKSNISTKISDEDFKSAINRAASDLAVYDSSKFGDDEFDGYRIHFFPTKYELSRTDFEEYSKNKFETSRASHFKNNWHHPQYWIKDDGTIEDMNLESIIEMLSDWLADAAEIDNCTTEWYKKKINLEKSFMSPRTIELVEEILFNILKL